MFLFLSQTTTNHAYHLFVNCTVCPAIKIKFGFTEFYFYLENQGIEHMKHGIRTAAKRQTEVCRSPEVLTKGDFARWRSIPIGTAIKIKFGFTEFYFYLVGTEIKYIFIATVRGPGSTDRLPNQPWSYPMKTLPATHRHPRYRALWRVKHGHLAQPHPTW